MILWPYLREYGRTFKAAIAEDHERTGGYIRDIQTLRDAIRRQGPDFDAWRDPQGRPYFECSGSSVKLSTLGRQHYMRLPKPVAQDVDSILEQVNSSALPAKCVAASLLMAWDCLIDP